MGSPNDCIFRQKTCGLFGGGLFGGRLLLRRQLEVLFAVLKHGLAELFRAVRVIPHGVIRVREIHTNVRDMMLVKCFGQLVPVNGSDQRVLAAIGEDRRRGIGTDEMKRGKAVRNLNDLRFIQLFQRDLLEAKTGGECRVVERETAEELAAKYTLDALLKRIEAIEKARKAISRNIRAETVLFLLARDLSLPQRAAAAVAAK